MAEERRESIAPKTDDPVGSEPRVADHLKRSAFRFRFALNLATMGMMGLSWPLWAGETAFPRVPFIAAWPVIPAVLSWGLFGGALLAMAVAMLGRAWRGASLASVALVALMVVGDQNRLQPWVYQYLVTSLLLAASPTVWGLRLSRGFLILLYGHSAFSKLDLTFARELGPAFLRAALRPLGLSPEGWPVAWTTGLSLVMPGWELLVALGLVFRKSRRWALTGAVGMHLTLLGVLGPWGLGHSAIVLAWNAALLIEDLILFRRSAEGPPLTPRAGCPSIAWLLVAVGLLPFGERWGFWDTWPSFAVYASHNERTVILIHRDDRDLYPPSVRRHLVELSGQSWLALDLVGWSRDLRGVPIYPQGRVGNAVAEALAKRYRTPHPLRVIHLGGAARLTGERQREESVGLDAIRHWGDRFPFGSQPAGHRDEEAGRWGFGTDRAAFGGRFGLGE